MDHEVPLTLYALEQSFRRLRVALVTLFNDILLFLHFGSASGMPPVPQSTCYCLVRFRLARVRSSGRAIALLALSKPSSPVPSHPNLDGQGKFRVRPWRNGKL
jgi:hypothetical protein